MGLALKRAPLALLKRRRGIAVPREAIALQNVSYWRIMIRRCPREPEKGNAIRGDTPTPPLGGGVGPPA